jgi:ribosomal protein S16
MTIRIRLARFGRRVSYSTALATADGGALQRCVAAAARQMFNSGTQAAHPNNRSSSKHRTCRSTGSSWPTPRQSATAATTSKWGGTTRTQVRGRRLDTGLSLLCLCCLLVWQQLCVTVHRPPRPAASPARPPPTQPPTATSTWASTLTASSEDIDFGNTRVGRLECGTLQRQKQQQVDSRRALSAVWHYPSSHTNRRLNPFVPRPPRYWLGVGAHPSDRVTFLLSRAGLIPPPPKPPVFPKAEAAAKTK